MLKCACVFDRTALDGFFATIGQSEVYDDFSMYFGLFEDGELVGLVKMYPEGGRCRIEDLKKTYDFSPLYDEFLLKSAINFALTFSCEELITTKKYSSFLCPMGFKDEGEELVGKMDEIDFPHNCKH